MSKKSNSKPRCSATELLNLFKTNPEKAYESLISCGFVYRHPEAKKFWGAINQSELENLCRQFPASMHIFSNLPWLQLLNRVYECLNEEKAKLLNQIVVINPAPVTLVKSFFLCVELGDLSPESHELPKYDNGSLRAIKLLLNEISRKLKPENQAGYSVELVQLSTQIIRTQADLFLMEEYLDMYLWADFRLTNKEEGQGYQLKLPEDLSKKDNLFILNHLKSEFKRSFKQKESQPKISEEEHFQKNDPKWKSNEGLATFFHTSGITIKETTPGTTSMQVDDDTFLDSRSEDPEKQEASGKKFGQIVGEQNFHYQFRHALARVYQPNDEIDIHALQLQLKSGVFVTLYDLICVMSAIIATADNFRYTSPFPGSGTLASVKMTFINNMLREYPQITPDEIQKEFIATIVNNFPQIEVNHKRGLLLFLSLQHVFGCCSQVEELSNKKPEELLAMIDLLSGLDSPLPFNPLYRVGDQFYFSYTTCVRFDLNRLLYDHYISGKLFNNRVRDKEEIKTIDKRQKAREKDFTNSLKDMFNALTPYVESSLIYSSPLLGYDFGTLSGDFDVIAYFEEENIILPIQVKLSNVSPRTEMRKAEWVNTHIVNKALTQVEKDLKLLKTSEGLRFISDKLNIADRSKLSFAAIYPLIVTDNFFADHLAFPIPNESGDVLCISYFELKHLILNQQIHENQRSLPPFETGKVASQLIDCIENNHFWDFLDEFAEAYKCHVKLSRINPEYQIELSI